MSSVTIINTTIPHMHTHTAHTIAKLENVVPGKNRAPDDAEMRSQHWAISQPQKGDYLSGGGNGSQNSKIGSYHCFVSPNGLFFRAPEWGL